MGDGTEASEQWVGRELHRPLRTAEVELLLDATLLPRDSSGAVTTAAAAREVVSSSEAARSAALSTAAATSGGAASAGASSDSDLERVVGLCLGGGLGRVLVRDGGGALGGGGGCSDDGELHRFGQSGGDGLFREGWPAGREDGMVSPPSSCSKSLRGDDGTA